VDDRALFRSVGLRIVELRHAKGITQETLAERIGLDARDLRRIEAGANTTVRTLNAVARTLGVPVAELFAAPVAPHGLRRPGRPVRVVVGRPVKAKKVGKQKRGR
jgi:transcriptional regulator with XRE-family HTH domain